MIAVLVTLGLGFVFGWLLKGLQAAGVQGERDAAAALLRRLIDRLMDGGMPAWLIRHMLFGDAGPSAADRKRVN